MPTLYRPFIGLHLSYLNHFLVILALFISYGTSIGLDGILLSHFRPGVQVCSRGLYKDKSLNCDPDPVPE